MGGTGLRPVVSGVAPETGSGRTAARPSSSLSNPCSATKSGATPDLTGVTPVPPAKKHRCSNFEMRPLLVLVVLLVLAIENRGRE
jgi:hypothetical protein